MGVYCFRLSGQTLEDKMGLDVEKAMQAFENENKEQREKQGRRSHIKTTERRTSYNWSKTDLEMMRVAKERYGIEAEVEVLRMALFALATGKIPPVESETD
jgi:hypothetical protein